MFLEHTSENPELDGLDIKKYTQNISDFCILTVV